MIPEPAHPGASPRWPWWLLRVVATLTALSAFTQAVLAGALLSGRIETLPAHSFGGILLAAGTIALVLTLVLTRWPGGGPGGSSWPDPCSWRARFSRWGSGSPDSWPSTSPWA